MSVFCQGRVSLFAREGCWEFNNPRAFQVTSPRLFSEDVSVAKKKAAKKAAKKKSAKNKGAKKKAAKKKK